MQASSAYQTSLRHRTGWNLCPATRTGLPGIAIWQRFDGGTLFYLEAVRGGRRELATTTMRKFPGSGGNTTRRQQDPSGGDSPSQGRRHDGDQPAQQSHVQDALPGTRSNEPAASTNQNIGGNTPKVEVLLGAHIDDDGNAVPWDDGPGEEPLPYILTRLREAQPFDDLDGLYARAQGHQSALEAAGREIEGRLIR